MRNKNAEVKVSVFWRIVDLLCSTEARYWLLIVGILAALFFWINGSSKGYLERNEVRVLMDSVEEKNKDFEAKRREYERWSRQVVSDRELIDRYRAEVEYERLALSGNWGSAEQARAVRKNIERISSPFERERSERLVKNAKEDMPRLLENESNASRDLKIARDVLEQERKRLFEAQDRLNKAMSR